MQQQCKQLLESVVGLIFVPTYKHMFRQYLSMWDSLTTTTTKTITMLLHGRLRGKQLTSEGLRL